MNSQKENAPEQIRARADNAAASLAGRLGGPLLVMYYPDDAPIEEDDIEILYKHLQSNGLTPDDPMPILNVALHTTGGSAIASYRLAQLLRDFAGKVTFVIPEYAYSGGTLITLAGEKIILAHYAVLSPIDVGFDTEDPEHEGDTGEERLEPIAMDHYIEMAANAKVQTERKLQKAGIADAHSAADEALMTAMIENPDNAMLIAKFYRERNIAEKYARQLLENYMLKNASPVEVEKVIAGLITQAPAHDLAMDYHICADIGLIVHEAKQDLSDLSKELVRILGSAVDSNIICERKYNNSPEREPFFHYTYYPRQAHTPTQPEEVNRDEHQESE